MPNADLRLDALEAKLANLTVDDLPVAALLRKIDALGIDGGVSLLTGTVPLSALALRWAWGTALLTWSGSSALSDELIVQHGIAVQPKAVLTTVVTSGQGTVIACHAGAYGMSNFHVQAQFVNGFTPGAGTQLPVAWLALG